MLSNSFSHTQEQGQVEEVPLLANQEKTYNFDLDLSHLAQTIDEKLPAIIITPCVPSSPLDYQIAFLASNKDAYLDDIDESSPWALFRSPAASILKLTRNSSCRARTAFFLTLPTIVIGAHLLINHFLTGQEYDGAEYWTAPFWS